MMVIVTHQEILKANNNWHNAHGVDYYWRMRDAFYELLDFPKQEFIPNKPHYHMSEDKARLVQNMAGPHGVIYCRILKAKLEAKHAEEALVRNSNGSLDTGKAVLDKESSGEVL